MAYVSHSVNGKDPVAASSLGIESGETPTKGISRNVTGQGGGTALSEKGETTNLRTKLSCEPSPTS